MDQSVLELMNAINHPKKINKFEHFKGYPSKGEIILAMHPIAKKWMRVLVNAVKKNFREITVEVLIILETLSGSFIYSLLGSFCRFWRPLFGKY